MSFQASEDLQSVLDSNFTYTNVTGLTGKPEIRLHSSADPSAHPSNGQIIVGGEKLVRVDDRAAYSDENYVVTITVLYDGTSSTTIKLIALEIYRVMRAVNSTAGRAYYYSLDYYNPTGYLSGRLEMQVYMRRELVAV